jgi:predicted dehydrogenase
MKIRAAIAGAGLMGFWHAQSIARVGGEVAAVCDVDDAAARSLANRFKSAHASTRLEDVLEQEKIDILHICTPLSSHFELAATALSRGTHVLIEKPMTPHCAETEQLYARAADNRVLLCPVHQLPFQRGVRRALAEFDKIGQLRHFEAIFCSAGGAGRSREEFDQIVAEILPHPLSLMQLFAPGTLSEKPWAVTRPAPGEFRATLTAQGICFSILISMNSRPTASTLRLLATAGTIHVDLFHGFCVVEPGTVSQWRKIIHPFDLSLRTLAAAGLNIVGRACTWDLAYPGLRTLIQRVYMAIAADSKSPIESSNAIEIAAARDLLTEKSRVASSSIGS